MSLLDGILGNVMQTALNNLGASNPQQNQLLQAGMQLIQQHGGLPGILDKFKQAGFGDQVASWVGTGANMPISADAITQALGNSSLGGIAKQLGVDPSQVSGQLAQALPQLINHLTPQGQVPDNHADLLQAGLKALLGR
ncbi:MAG: DUF937 domain-containing protein [Nevskiaceae bacterium]|nr:MAG: DUF937 domain-containing protein [Nevskiaceae bacterium]